MEHYLKSMPPGSNTHGYIVGLSGSGKSFLVFNKLLKEKLRYIFDDIYITSLSYETNRNYYDGLGLQNTLTKERRKRVLHKLAQGQFDSYVIKFYDDWFAHAKTDVYDTLRKLSKEKQDIVITDIESNVMENDEHDTKKTRVFKRYDEERIMELFKRKSQYPDERWLFVFDDCTYDDSFTSSKVLKMLLRNGRSKNISVWILSQKMTDLHPRLRSQFSFSIIFYTSSQIEQRAAYEQFGCGKDSAFREKFFGTFKRMPKYSFAFVILSSCEEKRKIYFNFETSPFSMEEINK